MSNLSSGKYQHNQGKVVCLCSLKNHFSSLFLSIHTQIVMSSSGGSTTNSSWAQMREYRKMMVNQRLQRVTFYFLNWQM